MYRVYLVDDEQLIREGIAETIPWGSLGLTLVGTAEDGRQALRGIRETHPDIVLTDIRMPHLGGLELIEKIREAQPECRVIIITGHGEFTYAQTAIQLGVSDFILKPIDIQSLCRTLGRIKKDLDGETHQRNEVEDMRSRLQAADEYRLQRNLCRYMMGRIPSQQFLNLLPDSLRHAKAMVLVLLQMDNFDHLTASMDEETIFSMTQQLEFSLRKVGESAHLLLVEESSGRYLLLFTGGYAKELQFEVHSYIRRLRLVEPDMEFTTVTSPVYDSIEKCQEAYTFTCMGCDYTFQLGGKRDVLAEEIERKVVNPLPDVPNVGKIIKSISTFNRRTILQDFKTLSVEIRQTGHNSYLYTHMLVSVVYGEIVKLLLDINCPIENILENPTEAYRKILACTTLDDMFQELYRFVAQICDFLEGNVSANKSIAERAKVYIEAHYADSGLTLNQVAEEMGVSPNYFSSLFKQGTNSSFINYLTGVRIRHAKEMLKTGRYKTYEVAMQCGYENPTYFSTIFKRQTGASPSEYHGD